MHSQTRPGWVGVMALAVATSTGCATLVNGRHQEVRVVSSPPGAQVWMNGTSVGTTPTAVPMRRRGAVTLRLEKPGYDATITTVKRRPSWWSLGNLIFLNPLAAQGMDSIGQWVTAATLYFVGAVTLDQASGGDSVRARVVAVVLTPSAGPNPEAVAPVSARKGARAGTAGGPRRR